VDAQDEQQGTPMASQPEFESVDGRRAERKPFPATVHFRAGNRRANVEVRDISRFGARIGGVYLVRDGDQLWLKLASLEAIEAKVMWFEDFEFGCEFDKPLSDIVLDSILRTA
jgi:PilZ domain